MKILCAGLMPKNFNGHLEMEILETHLQKGDEVFTLGCRGEMPSCDVNHDDVARYCLECMGLRAGMQKMLSRPANLLSIYNLTPGQKQEVLDLPQHFSSLQELRELRVENLDLGMATLSSLINCTGERRPDLQRHHRLLLGKMRTTLALYRSMQNYIDQIGFEHVYIFNGRIAGPRALVRACEQRNVRFDVYDSGHRFDSYRLHPQSLAHSPRLVQIMAREHWKLHENDPERETLSRKWYLDRINRRNNILRSFTRTQARDQLPEFWEDDVHKIVLFNTTEDELEAISDDFLLPFYRTQFDNIQAILRALKERPAGQRCHLYVRAHPNMFGNALTSNTPRKRDQWEELQQLRSDPDLTLIAPDDPIDSYALMEQADVVTCFCSTAGIEAAFLGTPAVVLGPTFYQTLGSVYVPETFDEALDLLTRPHLPKLPEEGILIYGFFQETHGEQGKYVEFDGLGPRYFKGKMIRPAPLYEAVAGELKYVRFFHRLADYDWVHKLRPKLHQPLLDFLRPKNGVWKDLWKRDPAPAAASQSQENPKGKGSPKPETISVA